MVFVVICEHPFGCSLFFYMLNFIIEIGMKEKLKRFRVRKNGTRIHSCETLRAAKGYITRLFNNGSVLPYDELTIYDSKLLMYINY